MNYEHDSLVVFVHKTVILEGVFDTDGAVGERVLGEKSVVGGRIFVERNDSPFVGEVVEVVEFVVGVVQEVHIVDSSIEGEVVLEVVAVVELAEVEVESEKTNQRGLPYDKMALSTSFWRPLLHCLSSSSGS